MKVVASLSQGRTAVAQCGLFTYKSVPVIFEPPCITLTHSMQQILFLRSYPVTASQETSRVLWKPKVHYCIYNNPPTCSFPKPYQSSPCSNPISSRFVVILLSNLRPSLTSGLFPASFITKTPVCVLLPVIRATRPVNPILLDLVTR